jgi:amidase/aspartyl-tRNA(Asn)/glutamyl-tRNA(Gln) amidotransferase subunit A
VAADIVPFAIATDTGGSARVPAAFCGIYGFRGAPLSPLIADAVPLAPSFDTAGWFTRTAPDMAIAIAALVGLKATEGTPRGCYLDVPGLDPEVGKACRAAAEKFARPADAGTRDELLAKFLPAAEVYGVFAGAETWKMHKKWADKYRDRYGPLVRDRLERARAISPAQLAAVVPSHASLKLALNQYFATSDFLMMPATPCAAPEKGELNHANRLRMLGLTAPASLAGLPVLTIPVPLPSGLSTGLQVIVVDPDSPAISWALRVAAQSSA